MILLAYSLYGRKAVQGTHLDILFCAVGAILFITSGGTCSLLHVLSNQSSTINCQSQYL